MVLPKIFGGKGVGGLGGLEIADGKFVIKGHVFPGFRVGATGSVPRCFLLFAACCSGGCSPPERKVRNFARRTFGSVFRRAMCGSEIATCSGFLFGTFLSWAFGKSDYYKRG